MAALLYIHCLILNNNYESAGNVLNNLTFIPYEGAKDVHIYYEQTKLMVALRYLKRTTTNWRSKK